MLKIPDRALPPQSAAQLVAYQADVDQQTTYPDRVKQAKTQFKRRNTKANPMFREVRATLALMCDHLIRCMYCEDSVADEVEHFKPKDLYPEAVFVWKNYFYACGPCNGPKNNQFRVITPPDSALVDVTRPKSAPIVPPLDGDPALIDPRREDPLDFMILDLRDTFEFTPLTTLSVPNTERAKYTIEVLRLNERDYLPKARENAFTGFRARLREFIDRSEKGASKDELTHIIAGIARAPHQTVWAEMKRQRKYYRELDELFTKAVGV